MKTLIATCLMVSVTAVPAAATPLFRSNSDADAEASANQEQTATSIANGGYGYGGSGGLGGTGGAAQLGDVSLSGSETNIQFFDLDAQVAAVTVGAATIERPLPSFSVMGGSSNNSQWDFRAIVNVPLGGVPTDKYAQAYQCLSTQVLASAQGYSVDCSEFVAKLGNEGE